MKTIRGVMAVWEQRRWDALSAEMRCRGNRTLKVVVEPVRVSFPVECFAGKDSTIYNQVAAAVRAPSAVWWSVTAGHGTAAQAESLDIR
ncbi:hypothetical protein ABTZ78_19735 [Streptomyces bauhiniae]|uniref:hypothetical protein n=1 Tax=Streptomyces bauhiniae TaxID=2340725 RepID=UPI00332F526E